MASRAERCRALRARREELREQLARTAQQIEDDDLTGDHVLQLEGRPLALVHELREVTRAMRAAGCPEA